MAKAAEVVWPSSTSKKTKIVGSYYVGDSHLDSSLHCYAHIDEEASGREEERAKGNEYSDWTRREGEEWYHLLSGVEEDSSSFLEKQT